MIRMSQTTKLFPINFERRPSDAGARWRRHLTRIVDALGTGAGAIPLGDNGKLFRELAQSWEMAEMNAPVTCR